MYFFKIQCSIHPHCKNHQRKHVICKMILIRTCFERLHCPLSTVTLRQFALNLATICFKSFEKLIKQFYAFIIIHFFGHRKIWGHNFWGRKYKDQQWVFFKKKKKSNYVVVDLHVHFVTFWYQKHLTYCNVLISRIFEILQHIVSSPQEFCLKKKQFKVKWKKNENLFIFIRAITLTDYYYILVFFFKIVQIYSKNI